MRKDVRMGFSVGAVLLAVIIVAVLVIHRGKNNKTLAIDTKGTANAPAEQSPIDVDKPSPGAEAGDRNSEPAGPVARPDTPKESTEVDPPETSHRGNQWDALFATADDPVKAELTSQRNRRGNGGGASSGVDSAPRGNNAALTNTRPQPKSNDAAGGGVSTARDAVSTPRDGVSPRPASSDVPRTHKVVSGETFTSIARLAYGDGRFYLAIEKANPNVNPEKLKPGTPIQLPPAALVKAPKPAKTENVREPKPDRTDKPAAAAKAAISGDGKSYTVQPNDNLYKIAKKIYGKGEREDDLFEANRSVIGEDRSRLKPGMVLKLPDPAAAGQSR